MATRNPLNEAVIAQVIEDLRNGLLHRCRELGFGDAEIEALKRPEMAYALASAQVQWCSVVINRRAVASLLNGGAREFEEVRLVDRYLRAGISTELLSNWYGLTHQEVAARRQIINWSARKGRPSETTEDEERLLWQHWQESLHTGAASPMDESLIRKFALEFAEQHQIPMAVTWARIQDWIACGRG
jgi:hypothetical protein